MLIWSDYPLLSDREELCKMLRKGYTFDEIARIAGCTKRSVVTAVRHHGIRYPIVMVSEEQKKRLDLK